MNRRSFLKSTAIASALAFVPTWLRAPEKKKLDLQAFCSIGGKHPQYDMTRPFTQETASGFAAYATDGKCIVKTAGDWQQEGTHDDKKPPAERLSWEHDNVRGWKPWPKQDWVNGDAICYLCRGHGGDGHNNECKTCDGMGAEYPYGYGSDHCIAKPLCPVCKGKQVLKDGPRHQIVGHAQVSCVYDRILRQECGEMEYTIIRRNDAVKEASVQWDRVLFRFAEGTGILVPLVPRHGE
jgi:hypothetical protein